MAARRIYRTIQADDGKWYMLPNATYQCRSVQSATAMRDTVQAIAEAVWKDVDVVAAKYDSSAWTLEPLTLEQAQRVLDTGSL